MFSTSIVIYNLNYLIINNIISELINSNHIKKIFIVYNGNNDQDYQKLLKNFKKIEKLRIFKIKNKGFGNAHNYIIKKYNLEKYHIVLNPDVIITSINLKKLNDFLSVSNDNISLISTKINDINENYYPSVKLLPTPKIHFLRRIIPSSKFNKEYELRNYNLTELINVPALSGCFMVINSKILKRIEGFDENFFLYFEDIDIIRRLSKFGEICYLPTIEATHLHQADSKKSFKYLIIHLVSLIKYYAKWGWFFDNNRLKINKDFLNKIQKYKKNNV